ncbi:uncharacterized protein LOC132800269 [Ziziphus jujuba]|uniref:Uncharacterized protein LOC132800269 n=1 Tax=Ziziphus jujuba TaxID=326968 RepID=A0A6P6FNF2_ZIZJJ|nr:uncharacterized protein LOC132800269 [Ziziphus jujuba]XP_060669584.1 uncharacterized protein LOC132800269 [Ziziphus jujuba]
MVLEPWSMAKHNPILMVSPFPSNQIELDDSNYFIWRSQVLPIIKGHKFIKFLEFSSFEDLVNEEKRDLNSEADVENLGSNLRDFMQAKENWYIQDQFLVGWLKGTISPEISSHFIDKDSTYKLWNVIENRYAAKSQSRILHYKKLLQNTKKGNLSIDALVLKMKDLMNNLIAAGDNASETDLVTYILGALGTDYEPISTILGIRPEQYTVQEVQSHLLAFECKHKLIHSIVSFNLGDISANYIHARPHINVGHTFDAVLNNNNFGSGNEALASANMSTHSGNLIPFSCNNVAANVSSVGEIFEKLEIERNSTGDKTYEGYRNYGRGGNFGNEGYRHYGKGGNFRNVNMIDQDRFAYNRNTGYTQNFRPQFFRGRG